MANPLGGRVHGRTPLRLAWIATTSTRHYLLIRRHLVTGELAFHYRFAPEGRPVTMMTLVRVACLRWPVEEGFKFDKDHFGLDHSRVRLHTALSRSHSPPSRSARSPPLKRKPTDLPILPFTPDEQPPANPSLIALTVAEMKRLLMPVARRLLPEGHPLRWVLVATPSPGSRPMVPPPRPIAPPTSADVIKVRLPYSRPPLDTTTIN